MALFMGRIKNRFPLSALYFTVSDVRPSSVWRAKERTEREIRKFDSNHLLVLIYNHSSGGRVTATHKSPPLTYIGKRGRASRVDGWMNRGLLIPHSRSKVNVLVDRILRFVDEVPRGNQLLPKGTSTTNCKGFVYEHIHLRP